MQLFVALAAITRGLADSAHLLKPDGIQKAMDDNAECHQVLNVAERKFAKHGCGMEMHAALEAIEAKNEYCQQLSWGKQFEASRYELHDRVRSQCGSSAAPYDTYRPDRNTKAAMEDAEEKLRYIAREEKKKLEKGNQDFVTHDADGEIGVDELERDFARVDDGEVEGEADLEAAQNVLGESNLTIVEKPGSSSKDVLTAEDIDQDEVVTTEDLRLVTAEALDEHPDTETLPLQENNQNSADSTHIFLEGDMRVKKEKGATLLAIRKLYKIQKAQLKDPLRGVGETIEETGVVIKDTLKTIFRPPKNRIAAGDPWPNGDVPFCFDPQISGAAKRAFHEAVNHYMYSPIAKCIRFREVSASGSRCETGHGIFVHSKEPGSCWADMGYAGSGGNEMCLGKGCEYKGVVIHEIGHSLGMDHEQSRPDRDKFIKVKYENIKDGLADQFDINPHAYTKETYDYLSIMHYGQYTWSKDRNRLPTIEALNGPSCSLGQAMGLSDLDIKQLGDMYCVGVDMSRKNGGRASTRSSATGTLSPASRILGMVVVLFSTIMAIQL